MKIFEKNIATMVTETQKQANDVLILLRCNRKLFR